MPLNSHASPQVGILIAGLQMKPLRFRDAMSLSQRFERQETQVPKAPAPRHNLHSA